MYKKITNFKLQPNILKEMENICRTCLRSPETLLPLFDETQLPQKIETISSVQISETDNLPTKICAECVININLSYNFRRVVINSDVDLKQRLFALHNPVAMKSKSDEVQFVEIEVKTECDDQTEECDLGEQTSDTSGEDTETEIKMEQVEDEKETEIIEIHELRVVSNKVDAPLIKAARYSKYRRHKQIKATKSMCNICGKSVRTDNLKKHIGIHTEPPVACNECGKVCKNNESLRSHVLIHKGVEITCEFCGQVYKYRGGYKRHVRKKHTLGVHRKVKCHLCEKMFHEKTDLKKHLRSHTGERPYPCEYCKKGFSSTHALKTHVRQHTNERPYTCEFCPMAFPQKVSLRTHLKSKHSVLYQNGNVS